jgi:SAM-dependent methyltransferase
MTDDSIGFFTGLAAETWARARGAEETAAEAAFLLTRLALGGPAHLLDVPCGDGRLARAIAAHGHRVTGVDGSSEMLAAAAAADRCEWLHGDMAALGAALGQRTGFDGAFCVGNAIGYQPRSATGDFLCAIAGRLAPGARFVIETEMTAESVLPGYGERLWQQVGDILMVVEHRYDVASARLDSEYRFIRRSRVERRRLVHHIFTCGDLVAMLEAAGMEVVALEADMDGTPFALGDPRLYLTAIRRGRHTRARPR